MHSGDATSRSPPGATSSATTASGTSTAYNETPPRDDQGPLPERSRRDGQESDREVPVHQGHRYRRPGRALANEETFETLRLLHEEFPHVIKCISTNGLLLPEKIDLLQEYDVGNITVTLNAIDPDIGAKIYQFVDYRGKRYEGREGAEVLLRNQLEGIRMAVERRMIVKVNTVYIPGINDEHIPEIAKKVGEMGVFTFNVIPLIAQYRFSHIAPPTPEMKRKMQDECAKYVRQMRHCQRCRADAIGKLGQDVQSCLYSE